MPSNQLYPAKNSALSEYLLMLRSRAKLTQAELAARIGVHRRSVQKWENSETYPTADNLRVLIGILLDLGGFTPGQERDEATTLWQSASPNPLERLASFDLVWFDQRLAARTSALPAEPSPTMGAPVGSSPLAATPVEERTAHEPRGRGLPRQRTPFIGRAAELTEITRILNDPACRLLTLLGPGGIGKTRIALEIAARQSHAFSDGVVFVDLASVATPSQMVAAIGETLNRPFVGREPPGHDPTVQLLDSLRTRHLLLLLDNFEHLLEGADLVYAILAHAPRVTILTTSRERLNLQAEWLFSVEGLAYPPDEASRASAGSNLADWANYSSVQLFMQRVAQLQPGFLREEATLPAIVRICQQVAGMPLAIELAAAGVRFLPITEIERQIGANLDVLATTLRDVPVRHRSLRAVFDQSWQLLNEAEQTLLGRLAVFRAGFTAAAAEQVAQPTLSVLAALVDKSLVRQGSTEPRSSPDQPAATGSVEPRFVLLAPIREYAWEKLAVRGEVQTFQRAHATYYLALAETAAAQSDSATVDSAIKQLNREHHNLRAALQWSRDGGDPLVGLQLAGALWRFWQSSDISEGRLWLAALLGLAPMNADATAMAARLRATHVAAWLASDQNDFAHAERLFEQSMVLRRALRETESETHLLVNAARQARAVGDYHRATTLLEDVLARQRALGDRGSARNAGLGMTLYELGLVRRAQGDFARAVALFEECIKLHRSLGDREGLAQGLLGLGDVARDQGDVAGMRKYCTESLAIFRAFGTHWATGFALNNLALAAYLEDDLAQAWALVSESVNLFRTQKAAASLAETLVTLGQILRAQGDTAAAYTALSEALELAQVVGPRLVIVAALEGLAANLTAQPGQASQAAHFLAAAAKLRTQMGTPVRPADRPVVEHTLAITRSTLGADTFAAIESAVGELPLEQILNTLSGATPFVGRTVPGETQPAITPAGAPPMNVPPIHHELLRADWGLAQDVPVLYGRAGELATLTQWVMADRCRLITLVGIGGIGKTSLAVTLARQLAPHFAAVVFRSLGEAPPLPDLLDQLIPRVAIQQVVIPPPLSEKVTLLIDLLRQARCLLILDNLETLRQPGTTDAQYLAGYEAYGALFKALGETAHQSCLLLTSRERLSELTPLEGPHAAVRNLRVTGLTEDACHALIADQELTGTAEDVAALVQRFDGNPLALKLVAEPVQALFGGNMAAFLSEGTLFFTGVGQLLEQQISRASLLEQALLTWLAIEREPVTLEQLMGDLIHSLRPTQAGGANRTAVLAALHALWRRNLIERGPTNLTFTLQRVVLEYLTERLVTRTADEIQYGGFDTLLQHALMQATTKDYVRHSQERLIAMPLLQRLTGAYKSTDAVERQLLTLLDGWREQPLTEQGYGPGNVLHLLRLLRGNLRGLNLARLALLEVYWQGVEAQDSSLAQAFVRNNVFTEAFGIVHAVASTPSGSYWAASSVNGAVQVWRDEGRTTHLSIPAHSKQVKALAFSPDEQSLASGSWDCTIKLWDMQSGALLGILEGHTDYVQDIAFAPDGRRLASGSDDQTVRIWDIATGACLQTIHAHTDNTYGVVWSSDGKWVASCGFDHRLRVWDVASGECVQTFSGHTRPVSKLVFSPDQRLLASGGFDRTLRIWDVASGACIKIFAEHDSTIMALAWSPDGHTIASCSYDGTIRLWELAHDRAQRILSGHLASINSIAFSAGGKLLLSGSDDQTVRVWDVASGGSVRVIEGYGLFCFGVVWSPDNRSLLSANSDTTLTLWNVADGTARLTLRGHTHTVYGVAWSPDGRWLASSGFDQTVRIWDAKRGVCVRVISAHTDTIYRVAWWSPDGRWLASAGRDQAVRIWDITTGASRWIGRGHTGPINEVVWSPDGQRLASCGEDRTVRLWRATDGLLLQTLTGHESSIAGLAWSPDGRWLASCGGGGTFGELFLWDAERGERINSLVGHGSVVSRVAWSQDSKRLFSGGITGAIRWWDAERGVNLQTRHNHQGWIRSLSVSPDGSMLVSSGEDGLIHLWDTAQAALIRTLRIDRPYERMDISGLAGITKAQRAALMALGAVEHNL